MKTYTMHLLTLKNYINIMDNSTVEDYKNNKQAILEELAMRLPYGVKCSVLDWDEEEEVEVEVDATLYEINSDGYCRFSDIDYQYDVDSVTPLLRYADSLTKDELKDAAHACLGGVILEGENGALISVHHDPNYGEVHTEFDMDYFRNGLYGPKNVKWLLQNHVDFNNMLNDGLAKVVDEDNNPYKK